MSDPVLDRMAKAREWLWRHPDNVRSVTFHRPTELQFLEWSTIITVDRLVGQAVAWQGWTEAHLLGSRQGSTDALDFSKERLRSWADEHVPELIELLKGYREHVVAHFQAQADARKNS